MFDDDEGPFVSDSEERAGDAEQEFVDVPEVDPPTVRDPADGLPDPSSVDPSVSRPFVTAVGYANVALFGVSLGLMLVGFRGEWRWGGAAVLVGLFAAVRVYQTYRAFERDRTAEADPSETDASPDDARSGDGD